MRRIDLFFLSACFLAACAANPAPPSASQESLPETSGNSQMEPGASTEATTTEVTTTEATTTEATTTEATATEATPASSAEPAQIQEASSASSSAQPVVQVPMPPQVRVLIAQMEEDLEAVNTIRPLLARVRGEVALPGEGAPQACGSDLRERVTEMIRRGLGPAGSGLSSIRDAIDGLCARFERWHHPDERWQSRIAGYFERLDRIDEWMRDIRSCVNPGPYDFRCENAYGAQEPGDAEQARAAQAVVSEVRTALAGVPQSHPFPCYSPVWRRVAATTWTMSVARAQIPSLASSAQSLCESMGVDPAELNEEVRNIRDRIDRSSATLVQIAESREDTLLRMRATYAP